MDDKELDGLVERLRAEENWPFVEIRTGALLLRAASAILALRQRVKELEEVAGEFIEKEDAANRRAEQAERDVNTLNDVLRLAGWGQGEIDSTAADVADKLEALERERDALRKDAERLEYLFDLQFEDEGPAETKQARMRAAIDRALDAREQARTGENPIVGGSRLSNAESPASPAPVPEGRQLVPKETIAWIQNAHDELWPSDPKEMLAAAPKPEDKP